MSRGQLDQLFRDPVIKIFDPKSPRTPNFESRQPRLRCEAVDRLLVEFQHVGDLPDCQNSLGHVDYGLVGELTVRGLQKIG